MTARRLGGEQLDRRRADILTAVKRHNKNRPSDQPIARVWPIYAGKEFEGSPVDWEIRYQEPRAV